MAHYPGYTVLRTEVIGQDSVLAPIYFYTQPYMLNPDIDGMYYTPLGYYFFAYTSQK